MNVPCARSLTANNPFSSQKTDFMLGKEVRMGWPTSLSLKLHQSQPIEGEKMQDGEVG